ncbi:hypothetical protein L6164_000429 [Bauhinia variegata]|uniref:Uncharacterized protein n=1 Tax=Bauhinia variegata TaxID=167791 RepID=A0ACB9Q8K6_BAUVA|nr:hypothetical protein L6164_000429 [Bauhinia variegata]
MASPPSPKPFSSLTTSSSAAAAASPSKKSQPIPWTHQETVNLIRAYQEKWYSLKRGQLRASQWEEVAVTVAARCGYDYNEPSKSAVQCRHKMEKLRQRYRAEKHRVASSGGSCGWQYFDLMDQLERGPMPISARPLVSLVPFNFGGGDEEEDEDDEEDEDIDRENYSKSRSISHILSQQQQPAAKFGRISEFYGHPVGKKRWIMSGEEEYEEEEGVSAMKGGELVSGLAAEIKGFAERFIGMENLKMEMMKETVRCRLEMENKRIEMILESQQRIVDSIGRAFGSSKRMKISQEI